MCHMSGLTCQVSGVRCQVSGVTCQVSCVRCHMFFKESPLGRFFHIVAMSVLLSVCFMSPFHVTFFEDSHWPSDPMISSRPLIGQPSFTTKLSTTPPPPHPGRRRQRGGIKKCLKASWRRCYYPHRSKDSLSPICPIFFFFFFFGQSGEASRWRVCYQRGLSRLVF